MSTNSHLPAADDADVAWARETAARLNSLPPRQADALRLLYRDKLTARAAAARLGLSAKKFNRIRSQGMHMLAAALLANRSQGDAP